MKNSFEYVRIAATTNAKKWKNNDSTLSSELYCHRVIDSIIY